MAVDDLSRVFAALADPTRRDMVARLASGDATVGELADPYDVSVQAISKHIQVLTDAGLVTKTKDAQRRPCHLVPEVFEMATKWIERYRREAEERYQRLDAVLADMRTGELAGESTDEALPTIATRDHTNQHPGQQPTLHEGAAS
jgi:DNA-binding transcriptional ArsR family regulator